MYPDPRRVRDHRVVVRLDDYELALLQAMAQYRGQPLSTFMRELLMQEADSALEAAQQQAKQHDNQ
jgi:uncharacterized protein (DUF1778 family)